MQEGILGEGVTVAILDSGFALKQELRENSKVVIVYLIVIMPSPTWNTKASIRTVTVPTLQVLS